jgi:hypothetical protein
MALNAKSSNPKLCPRCGAFYQDLASKTCPQCFAKLEILDDETAQALIAEQEKRASDPQILSAKLEDDEKFKEQAFGGCFSVVVIGLFTIIVCAVIIVVGAHHYKNRITMSPTRVVENQNPGSSHQNDIEYPSMLNNSRLISVDTSMVLPGSLAQVAHVEYSNGVQIYCVKRADLTDDQLSSLRFAVSFAAKQHKPELITAELPGQTIEYEILAPSKSLSDESMQELKNQ